jgi:hypothetical protein
LFFLFSEFQGCFYLKFLTEVPDFARPGHAVVDIRQQAMTGGGSRWTSGAAAATSRAVSRC